MEKIIKGTHHISIKAKDRENFIETVKFYHELLGMDIKRYWDKGDRLGAMIDTGNSLMEIGCGEERTCEGNIRHFALATDEVDRVTELVRNGGYKITMEPKDAFLPCDPPLPIRISFCEGPCGESIEFFCEKE